MGGGLSAFRSASLALGRKLSVGYRQTVAARLNGFRHRNVPVAMITGSVGKTTTSRLVAAILKAQGYRVGLACTDGIYVDGVHLDKRDFAGYSGARLLLRKHDINAAVLETARGWLLKQGFYMRPCNVGALLNVGDEHIGLDGIDDLDAMARLKARVVLNGKIAVLNGDDPRSARFVDKCGPRRVILFSARGDAPDQARVLAAGGAAVFADDDGYMVLLKGKAPPERIVRVADIPITLNGHAAHYAADAMAAAAIAFGLGVPLSTIARGLTGFRGCMSENPGRWTVFEGYPFMVVAERGMNAAAFQWTARLVRNLPIEGRRIVLLTAVGNRTERQYEEFVALAASVFDRFILYDLPEYLRGRAPGEIPALLKTTLLKFGVPGEKIDTADTFDAAAQLASGMARPGDMVLIMTGNAPEKETRIRQAFAAHALPVLATTPTREDTSSSDAFEGD